MKRPQGFDDRATRARVARPGASQGSHPDAAATPAGAGAGSRRRPPAPPAPPAPATGAVSSPRDRALTEPIALPVSTVVGDRPAAPGSPGSAGRSAPSGSPSDAAA
ncbi:hypothetical protein ACFPPE_18075, partial [Agromyces tardus]